MIGRAMLAVTIAGLAATARAQLWPARRLRMLLDSFAIVPEWRFYAQASITSAHELARDTHVVVRDRDAAGQVDDWRPVLCYADRRLSHALWNPRSRVDPILLTFAEGLADHARTGDPHIQQSIRYLTLLRHVLEAPRARGNVVDRQFAVVRTIGRRPREVAIDFLSAWHRW